MFNLKFVFPLCTAGAGFGRDNQGDAEKSWAERVRYCLLETSRIRRGVNQENVDYTWIGPSVSRESLESTDCDDT